MPLIIVQEMPGVSTRCKNYGTPPGPDECWSHLQLDARPLFDKVLGLEFAYPGAPEEITHRFTLYNSINFYRSHIEEIFTHSGAQTCVLPPIEGNCTTFFPETDVIAIVYTLRNPSRADVEVTARWTSVPNLGLRHEAQTTGDGFTFGCELKCQSNYWAQAGLERLGLDMVYLRPD